MPPSRLDSIYRRLLITKFFTKGWGKPENLQRLFEFRKIISKRENCFKLVDKDYPVTITKEEVWSDCRVLEGHFVTPLDKFLPDLVPEAAKSAHFQILLPLKWKENNFKPMCLHLAGTGDHYFWRRRNIMAKPLLKESGIGSIILENPFYGLRKPKDQVRSCLHNVTDIFVMGGCLVLESLVLFHWCERNGFGPLGVTGLSMGGHMASLAATNWPKPIVLVPCLSWSTASAVFTRGVLSQSINWELLETQYLSDGVYKEKLSKMVTIVDDAFLAGKRFVQNFSQSMSELKQDMQQHLDGSATKEVDLKLSAIKIDNDVNKPMNKKRRQALIKMLRKMRGMKKYMSAMLWKNSDEENFDVKKLNWRQREAMQFMRGVMDECTHLSNFSIPYDTSLIIAVCAKDDAYVPRDNCGNLEDIWPGAEVRYVNAGHVSAYVLHQGLFRSCIKEAFERYRKKWMNNADCT
ncbi:protein ABHD18-like isoform X3 [Ctenocephalides felis]|uniref:protein ABHD18-like isoform X3 n=1 Tax=Ctenocephalides felis TaxID=7515 RepID=UPI000E6E3B02|nr:protein ABHD18-like isoform X3 [Ctenocephalides felis]